MKLNKKLLGITTAAAVVTAIVLPFGIMTSYADQEDNQTQNESTTANTDSAKASETSESTTANENSNPDLEDSGEKITLRLLIDKTLDNSDIGFDRDKSKNQFAFRLYDNGGTDENGKYTTIVLPRDTEDKDNPDTPTEEGPGHMIVSYTFNGPGEYVLKMRELLPEEGLKDEDGKPLPEKIDGMKYDTHVLELKFNVMKTEEGMVAECDGTKYSDNSVVFGGFFDNYSSNPRTNSGTLTANGKTGTVTLKEGETAKFKNDLEFINITDGNNYVIESILFKNMEPIETVKTEINKATSKLSVEFQEPVSEAEEYNVVTLIRKDGEIIHTYNGDFDVDGQRIKIRTEKSSKPEPTTEPTDVTEATDTSSNPTDNPTDTTGDSANPDESSQSADEQGEATTDECVQDNAKAGRADTGDRYNVLPLIITACAAAGAIITTGVVLKVKKQ